MFTITSGNPRFSVAECPQRVLPYRQLRRVVFREFRGPHKWDFRAKLPRYLSNFGILRGNHHTVKRWTFARHLDGPAD